VDDRRQQLDAGGGRRTAASPGFVEAGPAGQPTRPPNTPTGHREAEPGSRFHRALARQTRDLTHGEAQRTTACPVGEEVPSGSEIKTPQPVTVGAPSS
jgi:hypothetical protein